ncbi:MULTISPECIES: hypothetical protein [Novosphingobium]|uniref:hypothetical protein n=1 Tax=Novosphingobium TaxID=165696 RepID=UPI0022F29940|nr:hypothetical protein [Novosphingobium resinovorum]
MAKATRRRARCNRWKSAVFEAFDGAFDHRCCGECMFVFKHPLRGMQQFAC